MSISCRLYRLFIDPLLRNVRRDIAQLIPEGSSILELGSGTGAQAAAVAGLCSDYLGIDIDPAFASCARKRYAGSEYPPMEFLAADGRDLDFLEDRHFDIAMITLALHEMPHSMRLQVLEELSRVADRIIIADYAAPLPHTFSGRLAQGIELLAGGSHYAGFKQYQEIGGLPELLKQSGLSSLASYSLLSGVLLVLQCSSCESSCD